MKLGRLEPTGIAIVLGNLIFILIALLSKYQYQEVAQVYLIEMGIIGIFGFLALLSRGLRSGAPVRRKVYIMYSLLYAFILLAIFLFAYHIISIVWGILSLELDLYQALPASGIFLLSHGFSFLMNEILKGPKPMGLPEGKDMMEEYLKQEPGIRKERDMLFIGPFTRSAALTQAVTLIIFVGVLIPTGMFETASLMVLMGLKTLWDLQAHQYKHHILSK